MVPGISYNCSIINIWVITLFKGESTVKRSKLHLVDLAGSERIGKSGVTGQIATEGKYINLSLHYLEQVSFIWVIAAMSHNQWVIV